jgi:hypothetical protein
LRHYILILAAAGCSSLQGQTYSIQTFAGGGGFSYEIPFCPPPGMCRLDFAAVALDAQGNVFMSLPLSNFVVRLDTRGGLTLVAGNGSTGYSGDNGPATLASLNAPAGIAVDSVGNLYIADVLNNRIRKVSHDVVTTVAGNGAQGSGGNGGPATQASLSFPSFVAVSNSGDL